MREKKISIFGLSFWDLWAQKMLRNVASVKYQFMVAFFIVVVCGMFSQPGPDGRHIINGMEGLSFLGGGFLALATTRILMRTSLVDPPDDEKMDTDR